MGGHLVLWSLVDEKTVTLGSCFSGSHFAFCLQKILGRPYPVLVHEQTAVQKVVEHKEWLLLHLCYFFYCFETQCLDKKETLDSTCFFHIHIWSPRPHI